MGVLRASEGNQAASRDLRSLPEARRLTAATWEADGARFGRRESSLSRSCEAPRLVYVPPPDGGRIAGDCKPRESPPTIGTGRHATGRGLVLVPSGEARSRTLDRVRYPSIRRSSWGC